MLGAAVDVHLVAQRPPPELLDRDAHLFRHRSSRRPDGTTSAPHSASADRDRLAEPGRPADHDRDAAGQVGDVRGRHRAHAIALALSP